MYVVIAHIVCKKICINTIMNYIANNSNKYLIKVNDKSSFRYRFGKVFNFWSLGKNKQ